jgi:hypothetical protein
MRCLCGKLGASRRLRDKRRLRVIRHNQTSCVKYLNRPQAILKNPRVNGDIDRAAVRDND